MSDKAKIRLIKYGISGILIAFFAVSYVTSSDFASLGLLDRYRILCDAFSVPGLLLIMFGAMSWLSCAGAMDGISYCLKSLADFLIPGRRLRERETYGDYVVRQREKRRGGYGFLLISGAVSLAISFVFLALYYSVY